MIRPLLTRADVDAILGAFGRRRSGKPPCTTALRNRALVAVLAFTGPRISEALRMTPRDVDLTGNSGRRGRRMGLHQLAGVRGTIRLRTAKLAVSSEPERVRTVRLCESGLVMLEAWVERRTQVLGRRAQGEPLFCRVHTYQEYGKCDPKRASVMGTETFREALTRAGEVAGLPREAVHPHGFRHFHAVELMRAGVPVVEIQRLLGHISLASTQVYMARFGNEEALDKQAQVFEAYEVVPGPMGSLQRRKR